jgi:hypothetical protein
MDQVHHGPSACTVNLACESTVNHPHKPEPIFLTHLCDVASPELATWRAQLGPVWPSPGSIKPGRGPVYVDH